MYIGWESVWVQMKIRSLWFWLVNYEEKLNLIEMRTCKFHFYDFLYFFFQLFFFVFNLIQFNLASNKAALVFIYKCINYEIKIHFTFAPYSLT